MLVLYNQQSKTQNIQFTQLLNIKCSDIRCHFSSSLDSRLILLSVLRVAQVPRRRLTASLLIFFARTQCGNRNHPKKYAVLGQLWPCLWTAAALNQHASKIQLHVLSCLYSKSNKEAGRCKRLVCQEIYRLDLILTKEVPDPIKWIPYLVLTHRIPDHVLTDFKRPV